MIKQGYRHSYSVLDTHAGQSDSVRAVSESQFPKKSTLRSIR